MANPPLPPGFVLEGQPSTPVLPPGFEPMASQPTQVGGDRVADVSLSELITGKQRPNVLTQTAQAVAEGRLPASWQIPVESAEQALRAARQGLTFGFSDELSGLGAGARAFVTGGNAGDAYREARDLERARLKKFSEEHAGASALGQLGGGLISGTAPTRAAMAAPSFLAQLGRSTATGAGLGGLAGLGAGEGDIEQQAASAGTGALIGGVAAPLVTSAASGLSALGRLIPARTVDDAVGAVTNPIRRAVDAVTPSRATTQERALDIVGSTLRRSGTTSEQIENQLVQSEALGAKPEILADFLGDQGGRRLYTTRTLGGEGASKAVEQIANRGEGTAARVAEDVQTATSQRGQSLSNLDARIENRRKLGGAAYREAFGHGEVKSPDTIELLQNPRVAGILKKASDRRQAVADLRGEEYKPLFLEGAEGPILGRAPTVEDLHLLKTSLDDDIRQAYQNGEGQLGNALRDFKSRIVTNLENEVPAYRRARELYKGDIEIEEAITNGRNDILRKPVDELRRDFGALSQSEKDAYRSGAVDTILARKVDPKVDSADFARSLWGNADTRNRLKLLVKDENELVRLAQQFDRERRMARTNRSVLGGSNTAMREADIGDTVGQTVADVVTQGPQAAFVSTVGRWIRRAGGLTEPVADDVAKLLTTEGPETIRAVLGSLKQREQMIVLQKLAQERSAQSAANVSAQQATRNP